MFLFTRLDGLVEGAADDFLLLLAGELVEVHSVAGHADGEVGEGLGVFVGLHESFAVEHVHVDVVGLLGEVAVEDGHEVRIILFSVKTLGSAVPEKSSPDKSDEQTYSPRIFIKLPDIDERLLAPIYRVANFNKGDAAVIIYDESKKKYVALRGITMAQSDKVKNKLSELYGDNNVVFK
jgi:hypothetical protein